MRERPTRDQALMAVARIMAARSTCNRRQVGAVLAVDGRILSTGYAGAPSGLPHCSPSVCDLTTPCTRTVHAEANAIAFAARNGIRMEGATLYTTLSPCIDCAKLLINSGVKKVVYAEQYRTTDGLDLLRSVGVIIPDLYA